jgi:hypothetical protein
MASIVTENELQNFSFIKSKQLKEFIWVDIDNRNVEVVLLRKGRENVRVRHNGKDILVPMADVLRNYTPPPKDSQIGAR